MNTYGFFSINAATFQYEGIQPPANRFDVLPDLLCITNVAFRLMSYHSTGAQIGACMRMTQGATIICINLHNQLLPLPDNAAGSYYETRNTGLAQMCRGILDLWTPHGQTINCVGDIVGTLSNVYRSVSVYWRDHARTAADKRARRITELSGLLMFVEVLIAFKRRQLLLGLMVAQNVVEPVLRSIIQPFAHTLADALIFVGDSSNWIAAAQGAHPKGQ